ncbi:poly(ethylene terephthalate) hydrolase family protein [Streptomyces caelestis]
MPGEADPGRARPRPGRRLVGLRTAVGGGGAISAAGRRPSLKAAVPLAPFSPSQDLPTLRVRTMIISARDAGTVTPSYLDGLYAPMPAGRQSAFAELTNGGGGFPTCGNSAVTRRMIPWLKIFIDHHTRYTRLLGPSRADSSGISRYRSKCPCATPGQTPPPPSGGPTVGSGSDRSLDVPNTSQTNGTNQRWSVNANGTITSARSGLCLDAYNAGTANGTPSSPVDL